MEYFIIHIEIKCIITAQRPGGENQSTLIWGSPLTSEVT